MVYSNQRRLYRLIDHQHVNDMVYETHDHVDHNYYHVVLHIRHYYHEHFDYYNYPRNHLHHVDTNWYHYYYRMTFVVQLK